jgi:prolyl oligopeptidase
MKVPVALSTSLFVAVIGIPSTGTAQNVMPIAHREAIVDTLHGVPVPDPYRWLEDQNSADTRAWVAAQDAYARRFVASSSRRSSLQREIAAAADADVYGAPITRGGLDFFSTFKASGPGSAITIMVGSRGTTPRVLLSADSARQRWHLVPTGFAPSPDGRFVSVHLSVQGSNLSVTRIIRVADAVLLSDSLPGALRGSGVSWLPDGSGLLYERSKRDTARGSSAPVGAATIWVHRVGAQTGDELVFEAPEGTTGAVSHSLSPGGRFLVIMATDGATQNVTIWVKDLALPTAQPRLLPVQPGAYAFAGEYDQHLFFLTWAGAPNGKVVSVDLRADVPVWRDVVKETTDVFATWPGLGARVLGGRIVVATEHNLGIAVRIVGLTGKVIRSISLPSQGSIWSGFVGTPQSSDVYYQVSGMADPGTVYHLDLTTGRSTRYLRPKLDYDVGAILTERVTVPARDGAAIPLYVVRRRDTPLNGTAPLIMYGYGFGGWIAAPYFQPEMVAWVNRGGIWALPGLRGGGEYGDGWREAGARRNKQTGIDDYVAATEWLFAHHYSSSRRMVANTSSAGGALVAEAVLQHPDLYRAAILDYPVLDLLRYERFTQARQWRSEYGTVADSMDFAVLQRVSPYNSVAVGKCYPAFMVAPGEIDQTAPPLHAYKFVAALQYASSSCSGPALLRVSWGAGHNAGATPAEAVETWTDELAFLDRVVGMPR